MNKKIVYVTGCCGFMPYHLTIKCLKLGWYVYGIDSMTYASSLNRLYELEKYAPQFKFQHIDINNLEHLYDCDVFINGCAETHVDYSISNPKKFIHSNINGVFNILELLKMEKTSRKIPYLFQYSTDETYGDISDGAHTETDILKPSNVYSSTKASADLLIMAYARTYGIDYNIIRPVNNYGIYQGSEKLIPRTCKYLSLGKKIQLHNNGTPIRTWLHAEDTSDAIIHIIEYGNRNEIYNVSSEYEQDNLTTVTKIINCYLERDINTQLSCAEMEKYIDFSYTRSGQDVRYSLNCDKLKTLGWKANKEFNKELPSIVKYYKNNFIW